MAHRAPHKPHASSARIQTLPSNRCRSIKRDCAGRRVHACFWRETLPDDLAPSQALQGIPVQRVSDAQKVELPRLLRDQDVTMLIFARSFGCPFCQEMATQVAREILPTAKREGLQLYLVSIGTTETGEKFAAKTGFPAEQLFADEENATYDALGLNQGLGVTYISPLVRALTARALGSSDPAPSSAMQALALMMAGVLKLPFSSGLFNAFATRANARVQTPIAIASRAIKSGLSDLGTVLKDWQPWQPPKGTSQASIQGGTLVFAGTDLVWSHKDKATADHANMEEVLKVAQDTAKTCMPAGAGR